MLRSLATVISLGHITKHPNADRLVIAKALEFNIVLAQDYANEGDIGVYFQVDSVLPGTKSWVLGQKIFGNNEPFGKDHVLKLKKIRGICSHGLFIKLDEFSNYNIDTSQWVIGQNVTEILGVYKRRDTADEEDNKQDQNEEKSKAVTENRQKLTTSNNYSFASMFPDGPSKTDEPRIQSAKYLLDALIGQPYYITVKLDGSSTTVALQYNQDADHHLKLCSRNQGVPYCEGNAFWKAAINQDFAKKLQKVPHLVFQAECCGPKICANKLQLSKPCLFVFTIFDVKQQTRLIFDEMCQVCKDLDLLMVPLLEKGDSFNYSIDELQLLSRGFYEGTKNQREGIVVRSQVPQRVGKHLEWLSFKIINELYQLKNGQ